MKRTKMLVPVCIAAAGLVTAVVSIAIADPTNDPKAPAGHPEAKLPPGWTNEDMQACMLAGTPGKMHEHLMKSVGTWQGKSKMWMAPGGEPLESEYVSTVRSMFDGHYTSCEMVGDMPGFGQFNGLGIYGYDNVSKKFVSTWVDSQNTGIMVGTGELSPDQKTLTWQFTFNCPLTGKATVMREIETITGENTKRLEMFGPDPKSGKEYKMMSIEFTKKS